MAKEIIKDDGSFDNDAIDAAITNAYEDLHDPIPEAKENKTSGDEEKSAAEENAAADKVNEDGSGGDDDWALADDVRELIESLGLSEEDVKEFSGAEELQRHARLLDKQFREKGREAAGEPDLNEVQEKVLAAQDEAARRMKLSEKAGQQERGEDGKFKSNGDESYKPSLNREDVHEDIVDEFERMNEFYENRIKRLEETIQQRAAEEDESFHRSRVQTFDSIVDSLGHDDLFGKSGDISKESPEWEGRIRLWEAMNEVTAGIKAIRGFEPEISPAIVRRALMSEFAEEFKSKQHQSFIQNIQKQSKRKLGGGKVRVDLERPYEGPPERDPILLQAYHQLEKESGIA